jgi:hypothetical protein
LLPEHAEIIAKPTLTFNPDWYSSPRFLKYIRELIVRFGAIGLFTVEDPTKPIGWSFRKTGMSLWWKNEPKAIQS